MDQAFNIDRIEDFCHQCLLWGCSLPNFLQRLQGCSLFYSRVRWQFEWYLGLFQLHCSPIKPLHR